MIVHLDTSDLKGEFVLKLYDRRFSLQLRGDEDSAPWTPELESIYQEFAETGCASGFFDFCPAKNREDEYWRDDHSGKSKWTVPHQEAYLQFLCHHTYLDEKEAYSHLRDMQGKFVPHVFAHPWLQSSDSPNKYLDCPGILMDYIQGYPLTDIAERAPKEDWQYICDEAIQIIQLVSVRGILNRDISVRNCIVHQEPGMKKPKVFMIDFGLCYFRNRFKTAREFRELQAHKGEEGEIGYVMQSELKGGFKYTRSSLANDLSEDFMREDYDGE
jgi:hypothetical protein